MANAEQVFPLHATRGRRGGAPEGRARRPPLTDREIEVLKGLAGGLSDREIALRLLVFESAVRVHLRAILHKLRVRGRAQAAVYASSTITTGSGPMHTRILMAETKRIALIAHDNRKADLVAWMTFNRELLARHELCATRTTGRLIARYLDLPVKEFRSGPWGGDQQIGAQIVDGRVDFLIFFWDPLEPHPHDPDVRALLRIAVVWNIPVACNRASADFMISSPLMADEYQRLVPTVDSGGVIDLERDAGDPPAAEPVPYP